MVMRIGCVFASVLLLWGCTENVQKNETCRYYPGHEFVSGSIASAIKNKDYRELDSLLYCAENDINVIMINYTSVLGFAASRLDLGSMAVIMAHGAKPTDRLRNDPASKNAIEELLRKLPRGDQDFESVEKRRILVGEGFRMFMKNGLDSTYQAKSWLDDPLQNAISKITDDSLVYSLIHKKICTKQNYEDIGNALFWANDSNILASLIRSGADTSFKTNQGLTFVEWHRRQKHDHLEVFFKSLGY